MSGIDLGNPKVLANFLSAQAREGKGEFYIKEKVVCFRGESGHEFIVTGDLAKKKLAELEAKIPASPIEEKPVIDKELLKRNYGRPPLFPSKTA